MKTLIELEPLSPPEDDFRQDCELDHPLYWMSCSEILSKIYNLQIKYPRYNLFFILKKHGLGFGSFRQQWFLMGELKYEKHS